MNQEHAEAELTRAQAALAAGDLNAALAWARRAQRRFRRRGNETWAAIATLTGLRALFAGAGQPGTVATRAAALANRLRELGLDNDAQSARLLAARAQIARGQLDEARRNLEGGGGTPRGLETRLLRRLALAELGTAAGDRRATFRHARAGLTLLRDHRSRFGSLDLQTGTTSLGSELATVGLAAALEHGAPSVVFDWLERSRAQAFRAQAVHPPADGDTIDAVAELRQLAHRVRTAELSGRRDPPARRRCAELERKVRARGWQMDGTGEHHAEATFSDVCAELASAHTVLVNFLTDGDRLRALVITGGRARLCSLGELSTVSEAAARLRSDLDALCGRRLPAALEDVIRMSLGRQLAVLTEHLTDPIRPILADSDVVVVPTGPLSAIPWGLLPDLRDRPVTVTPSASTWLYSRRARSDRVTTGRQLLVAGPHLDHAADEVRQLAKAYPNGTVLRGDGATVDSTLRALDGCAMVHFAAHGHHEQENMLFSRLDLIDGPLMAYDIHQLGAVPEHVVLSSCDVGQAVVRAGDEILGFTAALLYSGSRTVVSSVARVDDGKAVGVMTAYHRALVNGVRPARALAEAAAAEPLMPLVCFGSG